MSRALIFACLLACTAAAPFTWDSCGTRTDRLMTTKVSVDGSLTNGSKVTVTASGNTNLHAPLETGAWQVRIYEDGVPKDTHTEVGDLMTALKFDDAKNTTFTMKVSFTLPEKQASGKFDANLVATDQSKADYLCLDVKYAYAAAAAMEMAEVAPSKTCYHMEDTIDHKCFEACADAMFKTKGITGEGGCPSEYNTVDKTQMVEQCPDGVTNLRYCAATAVNVSIATKGEAGVAVASFLEGMVAVPAVSVYCMNDPSKKAPYYCHVPALPTTCKTDKDCTSPWYSSYCKNIAVASKTGTCQQEMPPTCTTDKDCTR